ncbi:hypothetical protein AB4865_00920 [Capnocytophaga sp. ARDL2]|uniref:hypothetical protein n=1 Tax=Capnocytophaga sp. ARDL2 TaxID=3238809 RepID=UPI003555DC2D
MKHLISTLFLLYSFCGFAQEQTSEENPYELSNKQVQDFLSTEEGQRLTMKFVQYLSNFDDVQEFVTVLSSPKGENPFETFENWFQTNLHKTKSVVICFKP